MQLFPKIRRVWREKLDMITRKCVICGKEFVCYPSDNKITCSKDCRRERQRRVTTAHPVQWGADARARASARGQTPNLKLGVTAAQQSPIAGRFETNREAKIWTLIDPSGNEIVVRNLILWARELQLTRTAAMVMRTAATR